MDSRFKVIISNKKIYKEVDLPIQGDIFKIGTTNGCDIRLRKDLFFNQFELIFKKQEDCWEISCTQDVYISLGDVRKLYTKDLEHGDGLIIKYRASDNEVLNINYMIGFEYENKNYERIITISDYQKITIGSSTANNLILHSEYLNKDLVEIVKTAEGFKVYDKGTLYGVYHNGKKINENILLKNQDFLSIANFSFYYKNGKLYLSRFDNINFNGISYIDIPMQKSGLQYPKFNRSTRVKSVVLEDKIEVLDPPTKLEKPKNNIIISLIPALAMLAVTVFLRGSMSSGSSSFLIFSVCTLGIGVVTSILSFVFNGRDYRKTIKQRNVRYKEYIEKKKQEIDVIRNQELEILNNIFYSLDHSINLVKDFSGDLFDREPSDEDFLDVRLGMGSVKAKRVVDYKKQEKFDTDDKLYSMPEMLAQEFELINKAPVVSKFRNANAIGITGNFSQLHSIMKNMILDLCIRHHYNDLKIFILVDDKNSHLIHLLRFLPHIKNDDLKVRNIVCDDESKTYLFEYLYKELSRRENTKEQYPHFIIFVFNDMGIKTHPLSRFINIASELHVTFIFFENKKELLSQWCNEIIEITDKNSGNIVYCDNINNSFDFTYNPVTDSTAEDIAIKLAPIYCDEVSLEGNLTKSISLYELLNIFAVEDLDLTARWNSSAVYQSMAAPLGVKTKKEIIFLDLHDTKHGPHGLVAGTTGSGKSEILQSYILSMATLFHPYEVSFVIIDFKGGGMVNQFRDLPHLVGAITNIDGKEVNRSLLSIKAELTKRQNIFATAQVNHIDKYIKKYKTDEVVQPLPHLIIIVDEFAELKAEQPEFMKELISAARIGRSLGVHLILATQKPAGQVNEQIWSNSKFKLCLKVQTKEDSNEVIKSPLAAEILEPGRAYLQVGNNEIFELFQSAYSGCPDRVEDDGSRFKEFEIASVDLQGRRKIVYRQKQDKKDGGAKTQLEAIVDYVNCYCSKSGIEKLPDICLPPLNTLITYPEDIYKEILRNNKLCIGIYDNPGCQLQAKAFIDVFYKNTMILGSSQYGKTNLLQLLIRELSQSYSSEEINIYIIDFASMFLKNFEGLKHVGGVVCSSEDEKLKNLFKLLNTEIVSRKEKLLSSGVSSFSSYIEAGNKDLAHIILIIDNLTALKELYLQDNDVLITICREGLAVGISVVTANSQISGIGYKYMSNFSNRISLYCNDSNEYGNLFEYCKLRPENIPGRCLVELDKTIYECQTYLAFDGEREIDRVKQMSQIITEINTKNDSLRAKLIPVIPQLLTDKLILSQFGYLMQSGNCIVNGLDYSSVTPNIINLNNFEMIGLCGKEGSGRGNFVRYFVNTLDNISDKSAKVFIIDDITKKFSTLQNNSVVKQYTLNSEDIVNIIDCFEKDLKERYTKLLDGDENILENSPLLVLIIQNNDALNIIHNNKETLEQYKNIFSKYKSMKFSIILSNIENNAITYNSPEPLRMLKELRHFMLFDDLNNIKIIDIPLLMAKEFKKPIEPGDAYYMKENQYYKLKMALSTVNTTGDKGFKTV